MRALRRTNAGLVLDMATGDPAPVPGEAIVRPTRLGVSSADVLAAEGSLGFTGTLGHQFVGIVERVNAASDDQRRWEGKRVVGGINVVCARCEMCRAGLAAHCPTRLVIGLFGRDGCFADRFVLPVANLVEVPKGVPDDAAIFAEPLAAALHAAQICRIQSKPFVTILGDGPMGLLAAQVMAKLNASVRVLGKSAAKFSLAERWGIKHRHADEVGRRQDQDVVIDCTGSPLGLDLALSLVRARGKVVVASAAAPIPAVALPARPGVDLSRVVVGEVEVLGSRCGNMGDAIGALARGEIDPLPLVSRRMKLADAPAAIHAAKDPACVRVLLDP